MSLVTSPGLLLRSHDYSESSRIFRFLTPRLGIVAVIAKGVRRRSARGRNPVRIFGEGMLTFAYREDRDLHTLRDYQAGDAPSLGGYRRLAAASLVAELLLVHSLEEGDPQLYEWVRATFRDLALADESALPARLLAGGWRALALLGFPPQLRACVRCGVDLDREGGEAGVPDELCRIDVAAGGLVCAGCAGDSAMPRVGPMARADLLEMVTGSAPERLRGVQAHLSILEGFALHHLSPSRGLRTFHALRTLLTEGEQVHPMGR